MINKLVMPVVQNDIEKVGAVKINLLWKIGLI